LASFLRQLLLGGAVVRCGERVHDLDLPHARRLARYQLAETVCDIDFDRESRFDTSTSAMRRRRESVGTVSRTVGRMTDERRFEELLSEFKRVGVDLNSFPAGIGVHRDDALRILRSLPDGAGPAAFLSRVRQAQQATTRVDGGDALATSDRDRRVS
jgi:hypothetical protein